MGGLGVDDIIVSHVQNGTVIIGYDLRKKEKEKTSSYYTSQKVVKCKEKHVENKIAEELRILYVAMTRAKCEFYYIVNQEEAQKRRDNNNEFWAKYL